LHQKNTININVIIDVGTITNGYQFYYGYSFKTVKIGKLWWFAENLQTTKYKDGNDIPYITDYRDWIKLIQLR